MNTQTYLPKSLLKSWHLNSVISKRLVAVILLMGVFTISSCAQTKIDGNWQGQATGPTGQHFPLVFMFRTADTVLTGSMISPMGGDTLDLKNGSIHGNNLAFDIDFSGLHIHHSGVIVADSIHVTTSDQKGGGMSFTLGRVPR